MGHEMMEYHHADNGVLIVGKEFDLDWLLDSKQQSLNHHGGPAGVLSWSTMHPRDKAILRESFLAHLYQKLGSPNLHKEGRERVDTRTAVQRHSRDR